jgi:hypothetical protein
MLFPVVTSKWRLPVGVSWDSKQIHEQLRDDSDSFSEFNQDSGIDTFYGIDPDAEICGPDWDESCGNSGDCQASVNVNGDNDDNGGGGSCSGGYNDEDNDNEDWALWEENDCDFYTISFRA